MRSTTPISQRDERQDTDSGTYTALNAGRTGSAVVRRSSREQLDRAARVQRSLLPDVSGFVGGYRLASAYRPCETLAGDIYDIYCHGDGATLMVSDVMGHGAEAALITMLVKAVFQEMAPHIRETDALLSKMNKRLVGLIPGNAFAATAVASLDPESTEVQFSNAGLPYPFVLRASTQRVETVELGGIPLGLDVYGDSQTYDCCRVELAAGDIFLIASDGIGSIEGDDGECFEDIRLRRALDSAAGSAGEAVIETLLADAATYSNGRPFPDDINLIAVWRDGTSNEG